MKVTKASRRVGFGLLVMLLLGSMLVHQLQALAAEQPTRVINVVYDDSGSMIRADNGDKVDTWCQAKYSMEVFAAMLGANDTMNVYVMSDYVDGRYSDHPYLQLNGADGAQTNVAQVHDMLTEAWSTPFESVIKAYTDLSNATADEKWLIILTDGEFQKGGVNNAFPSEDVDRFFAAKDADINVSFLGMGASAAAITSDPSNNIYSDKAETNDQILNKITEICTRIFSMDRLVVNAESKQIAFDIPMSELIVFAQGQGVSIQGLTTPSGETIQSSETVGVKYSELATSKDPVQYPRYTDPLVDRGLVGEIATYRGEYEPGTYQLDVTDAATLEVYYKPDVEIMTYLVDGGGQEIPYSNGVKAGTYTLQFGFVKPGTTEKLPLSDLLGDVTFAARLYYNGQEDPKTYTSGDSIDIKEGDYKIDAQADYLRYNTLFTQMQFGVYRDKDVEIRVTESPTYQIQKEGIQNSDEPIVAHITLEGNELTDVQWSYFDTLEIETSWLTDRRIELRVEKSDTIGDFYLYPTLSKGKTTIGDYGNMEFTMRANAQVDPSSWTGSGTGVVQIDDQRSWFERNMDKVIKGLVALGILWLLGGYTVFKRRLPKGLKASPQINATPKMPGKKKETLNGRFEKQLQSVILPYVPERGTLRYVPKGVSGARALELKAAGGERMVITNTAAFEHNKTVKVNGQLVSECKGKELTAGIPINFEDSSWKYECTPNQGK